MKRSARERVTKDPEERKQELIDAAERLFMERGYEATAVSDIVQEVGVAQGTFYYYFPSKEEILEAIIEKDMSLFFINLTKPLFGLAFNPQIKLMEL